MKKSRKSGTDAPALRDGTGRRVRADARRSIDALLGAAKAVFIAAGVDAPVREIADRAGVGIGTVYRHFPQRADLIAAVFRHEVDACADGAQTLAAEREPEDALRRWVERYVEFLRTKRGLAAALQSGDPAYGGLPEYFITRLRPALAGLLNTAAAAGSVRVGVDPGELLWAIASLCGSQRNPDPAAAQRMIGLLLDGMRRIADTPAAPRRR